VVAGSFYPGDAATLRKMVETFLAQAQVPPAPSELLGVISPHAGYVYSGRGAGYAFRALQARSFKTAVLLAPSHRAGGFYFSVGDYESYQTPLGAISVDSAAVERLLAREHIGFHHQAHESEHSLEVQLPFLQVVCPEARIVPIVLGHQHDANSRWLAGVLAEEFGQRLADTVFIVSSDLSHYHDLTTAERKDSRLADHVQRLDTDALMADIETRACEACGFGGILTLMHLAKQLGYGQAQTLLYSHSGEASGDNRQVVGYLAAAIYR